MLISCTLTTGGGALAIALSPQPRFIILDEPTSGMDPIIRREVLDYLQKLARESQVSVLISSHITSDIERIADYISYMNKGRIILSAPKDNLLTGWKRIHYKKDSLDEQTLKNLENIKDHMFGSTGITRNYDKIENALKKGLSDGSIKVENIKLDDILIHLVNEV